MVALPGKHVAVFVLDGNVVSPADIGGIPSGVSARCLLSRVRVRAGRGHDVEAGVGDVRAL